MADALASGIKRTHGIFRILSSFPRDRVADRRIGGIRQLRGILIPRIAARVEFGIPDQNRRMISVMLEKTLDFSIVKRLLFIFVRRHGKNVVESLPIRLVQIFRGSDLRLLAEQIVTDRIIVHLADMRHILFRPFCGSVIKAHALHARTRPHPHPQFVAVQTERPFFNPRLPETEILFRKRIKSFSVPLQSNPHPVKFRRVCIPENRILPVFRENNQLFRAAVKFNFLCEGLFRLSVPDEVKTYAGFSFFSGKILNSRTQTNIFPAERRRCDGVLQRNSRRRIFQPDVADCKLGMVADTRLPLPHAHDPAVDENRHHIPPVPVHDLRHIQTLRIRSSHERLEILTEFMNQLPIQINASGVTVEICEVQVNPPAVLQIGGNLKHALIPARLFLRNGFAIPLAVC